MGQAEIQKILEKNKGQWFSTNDLKEKLNQTSSVITRALNKMASCGEVKKKKMIIKKTASYHVLCWCIVSENLKPSRRAESNLCSPIIKNE